MCQRTRLKCKGWGRGAVRSLVWQKWLFIPRKIAPSPQDTEHSWGPGFLLWPWLLGWKEASLIRSQPNLTTLWSLPSTLCPGWPVLTPSIIWTCWNDTMKLEASAGRIVSSFPPLCGGLAAVGLGELSKHFQFLLLFYFLTNFCFEQNGWAKLSYAWQTPVKRLLENTKTEYSAHSWNPSNGTRQAEGWQQV